MDENTRMRRDRERDVSGPRPPHAFARYPVGHALREAKGCAKCGKLMERGNHVAPAPVIPEVTELPPDPHPGQKVIVLNGGARWHFRYNAVAQTWDDVDVPPVPS